MLPAATERPVAHGWTSDAVGRSGSGTFGAPGLDHGCTRAGETRGVRVMLGQGEAGTRGSQRIFEQRAGDAEAVMTIDRLAADGFRIAAPGYGRFDVSADGRRVVCA